MKQNRLFVKFLPQYLSLRKNYCYINFLQWNQNCDYHNLFSKIICPFHHAFVGLVPDTQYCGLRMRLECRERFLCHRLHRKPLVSVPGMHHVACITYVPWSMSESLARGGGEKVPGIPGVCATHSFAYRVRGPYYESAGNWSLYTWKDYLAGCWSDMIGQGAVSVSLKMS